MPRLTVHMMSPLLLLILLLLNACSSGAQVPAADVGSAASAQVNIDNMRPEVKRLLTECGTMSPALFEINYIKAVTRAQTGAVRWSQVAVFSAEHPELRDFARRTAEEQTSLDNELTTYLSEWYDITQIVEPPADYCRVMYELRGLSGRDFEVAYMQAMIAHLDEMRALSEAVAVPAVHELLRQIALQTAAFYSQKTAQLRGWLADWYGVT